MTMGAGLVILAADGKSDLDKLHADPTGKRLGFATDEVGLADEAFAAGDVNPVAEQPGRPAVRLAVEEAVVQIEKAARMTGSGGTLPTGAME